MALKRPKHLGIDPAFRVWMRLHNFTLMVQEGEFGGDPDTPDGTAYEGVAAEATTVGMNAVWLGFQKINRKPAYVELTGMTEEELDLFMKGITHAVDAARLVCRDLDAQAMEFDLDTEEMPHRALRQSPPVVIRTIHKLMPEGKADSGDDVPADIDIL